MTVLPTPFHVRTAEHDAANAWTVAGAFTVPRHFGDPVREALAARFSAVLFDISPLEDMRLTGANAAALLSTAFRTDMRSLASGCGQSVHWCADGGGLRGFGMLWRLAEEAFLLRSLDCDFGWFAPAAPRFRVEIREATRERGLLLLSGPFAPALLEAADLPVGQLKPGRHRTGDWEGIGAAVFRTPFGFELSCAVEDGLLVFDRLVRAGADFGLVLAGQDAFDLLALEAGIPIPYADFSPARDPFACEPSPASLGFPQSPSSPACGEGARHSREAAKAGRGDAGVLCGLELDCDEPAPFAPVLARGMEIGRTLRSLYSPALKAAIALAQLAPGHADPGTLLTIRCASPAGLRETPARVVPLPFL